MGLVLRGVVKEGKVIPESPLPEGLTVGIVIPPAEHTFTPEEQAEFDAWVQSSGTDLLEFESSLEEDDTHG